jgi:hydroxylamine reductase
MQNNKEYNNSYIDINECTTRGACSISPAIAALEELSIVFLKQLAFYLLKLEKLGASNSQIKFEIITILATLVSVNEFSENQLFKAVMNEYYMLSNTKSIYFKTCKEQNISPKKLKEISDFSQNTTISQAITLGEKLFLKRINANDLKIENLLTILLILTQSISLNLLKLADFSIYKNEIFHEILKSLDITNHRKPTLQKITTQINKLAQFDSKLQIEICDTLLKTFGKISKISLSHSTQKGKAILVSGNSFLDLYRILEETKDKNIDIYTHSNLLITHALEKFAKFKHLKGHYGDTTENCILDFATFPGSILLTKNSKNNTEYFYRGRLFSSDYITPNGVIKIENNDYSQLIEAAKNAKGFAKGKAKPDTILGFNEKEIFNKIKEVSKNLEKGQIKHLYIIGINSNLETGKIYLNELFSKLKKDEFIISFYNFPEKENVLSINIGNYTPLGTNIIKNIFEKISPELNNITFFFTTCDVMTLSGIIRLKSLGVKHIYMNKCPSTLINPSVYKTFTEHYKIKTLSNSTKDLKEIRSKKSTQ